MTDPEPPPLELLKGLRPVSLEMQLAGLLTCESQNSPLGN